MEAIGFLSYYGFSPPIDVLRDESTSDDGEINILISDSGDIRHTLKTICDNLSWDPLPKLNFFIHEKAKENLARALLFLTILNETSLPLR